MDTRTQFWQRLHTSRDWLATLDELEKEIEASGAKDQQSERLFDLAAIAEEVVPERERALTLYQRAWKLFPDNLKALTRAREVYGELGRIEMVAKVGEMEMRSPIAAPMLPLVVGEAMLDSGQRDKAKAALEKALERQPNNMRAKEALAAAVYDPEFWLDEVDRLVDDASRHQGAAAARMLVRAARILRMEMSEDPKFEEVVKKALEAELDEPSANFMYETILTAKGRLDELQAHQLLRANAVPDQKAARLVRFGLEWIARYKDKARALVFFEQGLRELVAGGVPPRSVVAAFSLVHADLASKGAWEPLLELARGILPNVRRDDQAYVAAEAADVAWKKTKNNDVARSLIDTLADIAPTHPLVLEFNKAVPADPNARARRMTAPPQQPKNVDKLVEKVTEKAQAIAREAQAKAAEAERQAQERIAAAEREAAERLAAAERAAAEKLAAAERAAAERAAEKLAAAEKAAAERAAARASKPELPGDLASAMDMARGAESNPDKGVGVWREVIGKHPSERAPRRELARILRANAQWAQLADALRDEESKAAGSAIDKGEVLRELADVYSQLGNENQVMTTLAASLAHDPTDPVHLETLDKLAAVYESKKRWPDLVKMLTDKAERVPTDAEKVALHLQIAAVYLDKFSNQAEAIKAFERVLELDSQNSEAIGHLLAVYEKRREWEKLIKLKEVEIAGADEGSRAARILEVAQLAHTKVKKPEVTQVWWERVLGVEPSHPEALAELNKLYERNREWDKLADVTSRQAATASDAKTRVEAYQRLGILYTEKIEDSAKAISAWQQVLAVDDANRRAQDALKKLYVTEARWQELEEFYRSRGKMDEYLRVLEREVDAGPENHRVSLAMKIAELYRDELHKPDRAQRAFEKVLTLDPSHLGAAEALIPLYETSRDPKKLAEVLEIQLRATERGSLRNERLRGLAEHVEHKLRDKAAAFGWWQQAHSEDVGNEEVRSELERLAGETKAWQDLVDTYQASTRKLGDVREALPLLVVVMRVQEEHLGQADAALAVAKRVLELDARNEVALDAMERIYVHKQQYDDLLSVYQRKMDLAQDADERVRIQSQLGQLFETQVKDDAKAAAAYHAVLDIAGDDLGALGSLDRIYQRGGKWNELSDILTRQLALVGPDDNRDQYFDLKYRLGRVKEQHLADVRGAFDAYRDVLDLEPSHTAARAAIEAHLADAQHQLTAAAILEPIYESEGAASARQLVRVYEIQLAVEKHDGTSVALLRNIASLHRTMGDAEAAFEASARCFAIEPANAAVRGELELLADHVNNGWARVVTLYDEGVKRAKHDRALGLELATLLGRTAEERLGQTEKAVGYYRQALEIDPEHGETLAALEQLFTRDQRHADLLDVYRRRAAITQDATEKQAALAQVAALQETQLGNPDDAIAAYQEILTLEPDNVVALRSLDRLFTQQTRWNELADNLQNQLTLEDDDARRTVLLTRLAELREHKLADVSGAIEMYQAALEHEPSNRTVIAALERLMGDAQHELAVAQLLEPIYRVNAQWDRQIAAYEVMVRHSYDMIRKTELLHQIAELSEIGGDNAVAAFDAYARAMREDPRNETSRTQLERLARATGRWSDVVALYESLIQTATDEDLRVTLLTRVAQVHEGEVGDVPSAISVYERILATAPNNLEAASALQALHERSGNWGEQARTLVRKSEIVADLQEKKQLLFRAAQIQEEVLGDADAAIATFHAVLAADDVDNTAMDGLERLYLRLERWVPLKDVYVKKSEATDDPDDKKRLLFMLASVYDLHLTDLPKAIETYQAILDLDPGDLAALQALDVLLARAERWYDLLGNLERQVELASDTNALVDLKFRIGSLWQHKLGDVTRAIESYQDALSMDPGHSETLLALDGMVDGTAEPVAAARVLEPIYEASGDYVKLVRVLDVLATHSEEPASRVALLHRMAALADGQVGDANKAMDGYLRAVKEDSGNQDSLEQLERIARQTGRWGEVADLLGAEAEKSLDVPRQVELWTRLARIYEEEQNNIAAAVATHRRVLDADYENRLAVMALDRLYSKTENWTALADILKRSVALAESETDGLAQQQRLAQTLEGPLGDKRGAVEVYRDMLLAQPTHAGAQAALEGLFFAGEQPAEIAAILEPIYENSGEFERQHRLLEAYLMQADAPTRRSLLQRLAEIAEGRLGDAERAMQWWGQALGEQPKNDRFAEELERLASQTGAWESVASIYATIAATCSEDADQLVVLLRAGRVWEQELGQAERAIALFGQALTLDAKQPDALAALDRLYLQQNQFSELADILQRRVEIAEYDDQLELLFRLGQVQAEALGDVQGALATYERVLERDSRNRTALESVERIYASSEDWPKLAATYERLLDVASSDDEMADLYGRLAYLASETQQEEAKAVELWARVLDIRGEDPLALESIGVLHARGERWQEWIEVMERQANVTPDEGTQVELYKRMGRVWSVQLGRDRNALEAWTNADRLNPNDMETLGELARLYRSTQAWDELSNTLVRIVELGSATDQLNEQQIIDLYAELGQLEGEVLGRIDRAVHSWRNVLTLDPGDLRALTALESLFTREGRWQEAVDVLEKRSFVLDDPAARVEALLQAGATLEEKLEDLEGAAGMYERVRQQEPTNALASERLEAVYRAQYKWEPLTEVLLERYEHRPNIDLLVEVARIYEVELGNQDYAFSVLQEAFKSDYTHEATAQQLERLATATNRWQDLLNEYTVRVQELEREDRGRAADLWVNIGRWYGEHLSHMDYAVHSVAQALRIDPSHTGALTAMAELQRRRGAWGDLTETLQRAAVAESNLEKRAQTLVQLGEVQELQLQDYQGAMHAHQQALRADPNAMTALVALDRLYRRAEMWEPLTEILDRRAGLENSAQLAMRHKLEIGQIWDQRLGDSGQAIVAYNSVLDVDANNTVALRALESLYERTNQSEKYLEILEAQLDSSPSDNERAALYHRMGTAWEERFGKLDRAAECFEKLVVLDPRNYAAYDELARLYLQQRKYDALVETYRNHILANSDPRTRVNLYCAMGSAYEAGLGDVDHAIEAYTDVLSFDPTEPRALDALGRLYERIEEWDRAIEASVQLVNQTDDAKKQVELYLRMGRIQHQRLGDQESAESNFLRGLSIDPAHTATMTALVSLYSERGDWLKAAQMMVRAEAISPVVTDKVRLLNDAAHIYQNNLGQREPAMQLYADVIALDPEHLEAGRQLMQMYFEIGAFAEMAPIGEMVVRKAGQSHIDPAELAELNYQTAYAHDALGDVQRATHYYRAAYEIDSTHFPTLMGLANVQFKSGDWEGAGKIYQTVLIQYRDNQSDADVVQIYNRLGEVRRQLGEKKKALNMFEKALEIDPTHRETLQSVAALQESAGDWEAVVTAKRGLLATADEKEQSAILTQIGEIYHQKLQNPQKAIAAYNEALSAYEKTGLLQRLLDLYTETEQWKKTVEITERFTAREADPIWRGKYFHAAATICRDKLKSHDEAIDYFGRALDSYFTDIERFPASELPRALKAFESIDRIMTTKRDWKGQERAYRDLIKRVKDGSEETFGALRVSLFDALGEIYRSRLKHYQSAISALEAAQSLDAANTDRAEKLAELYLVAGPEYADKAAAQHMRMLATEPFKYDSYKALARIYMDSHQYDKRWCVSAALAFLKKADAEEQQFFDQYRPKGLVKAKSPMSPDLWAKISQSDENRYISAIFGATWQGVATMREKSYSHKELGIKRKDRLDIATDQQFASKVLYYVAQVLRVPVPEVFVATDDKGGEIQLANFMEKNELTPAFLMRPARFQGQGERDLAFTLARHMTYMRPEYYLKRLLPTNTELKVAFLSAIAMVQPRFPIPPDMVALVQQYLPQLQQRTPPHATEQLAAVVQRFMQAAPEVNLSKWGHSVDAATYRMGFVLCGDLEVASRLASADPVVVGGPQAKDRIKDLVLYSISEEYFAVRQALGLTIG